VTQQEAVITAALIAAVVAVIGWFALRRNAFATEAKKTQIEQRKAGMRAVYDYVDQVHGALGEVGRHLRGPDDQLAAALAAANQPQLSIAGTAMVEDHDELQRLMIRFREVEGECHRLVGEADRERAAGRSPQPVEDTLQEAVKELAKVGSDIRREGDYLERG
jgi:hypothetical protein